VEGTHGFIEDNFFRPMPDFADFDELNCALAIFCDASLTRVIAPNTESIGERFAREQPLLQVLPSVLPRASVNHYVIINKFAEVCFERNSYSVPTQYALRDAVVEAYDERLRIIVRDEVVAQRPQGFGVNERYLDLVHYVGLLQQNSVLPRLRLCSQTAAFLESSTSSSHVIDANFKRLGATMSDSDRTVESWLASKKAFELDMLIERLQNEMPSQVFGKSITPAVE
jgi:hypothetical protein